MKFSVLLNWQKNAKMIEIKNRFYKARRRARSLLMACGYNVTFLSDGPFDVEASRRYEIRKIKICLDEITETDRKGIERTELPALCRKEIWLKRMNISDFEIIDFPNDVNGKCLTT